MYIFYSILFAGIFFVQTYANVSSKFLDISIPETAVHKEINSLSQSEVQNVSEANAPNFFRLINSIVETINNPSRFKSLNYFVSKIKIDSIILDPYPLRYSVFFGKNILTIPCHISQILNEDEIRALIEAALRAGKLENKITVRGTKKLCQATRLAGKAYLYPTKKIVQGVGDFFKVKNATIFDVIGSFFIAAPLALIMVGMYLGVTLPIGIPLGLTHVVNLAIHNGVTKSNFKKADAQTRNINNLISAIKKMLTYSFFYYNQNKNFTEALKDLDKANKSILSYPLFKLGISDNFENGVSAEDRLNSLKLLEK